MQLTKLQSAVLNQLGYTYTSGDMFQYPADEPETDIASKGDVELFSTLQDIADHGVDGGFSGFTYYAETCQFALDNWADIIGLCRDMATDIGYDTVAQFIVDFRCLVGISPAEVEAVLMAPTKEQDYQETVLNALAWFALEETARAIVEGVENDA